MLERAVRESLRWHVLEVLDVARPDCVSEAVLLGCFLRGWPGVSKETLRREADYLQMAGLLTIKSDHLAWALKLTREGVDLVEYTVACPVGIARPPK